MLRVLMMAVHECQLWPNNTKWHTMMGTQAVQIPPGKTPNLMLHLFTRCSYIRKEAFQVHPPGALLRWRDGFCRSGIRRVALCSSRTGTTGWTL